MPQPSACPPNTDEKMKKELGTNLGKAVKSIPAYVVTSLPTTISTHTHKHFEQIRREIRLCRDRGSRMSSRRSSRSRNESSYQDVLPNVRNRGWCVLEMFRCTVARKTHPALLITSAEGTPEWVSPLEALKLAVGLCDFTCCQRNHKFGDKIVPCDRGITREILETLIASKVKHIFQRQKTSNSLRMFHCMVAVVDSWAFNDQGTKNHPVTHSKT